MDLCGFATPAEIFCAGRNTTHSQEVQQETGKCRPMFERYIGSSAELKFVVASPFCWLPEALD
jgi:hypothetical protein